MNPNLQLNFVKAAVTSLVYARILPSQNVYTPLQVCSTTERAEPDDTHIDGESKIAEKVSEACLLSVETSVHVGCWLKYSHCSERMNAPFTQKEQIDIEYGDVG